VNATIVRTLRTASSERYVLQSDAGEVVAVLDAHFLNDGAVSGTLILLTETLASEDTVSMLLTRIDSELLPHASFAEQSIDFTVVVGRALGSYVAEGSSPDSDDR
jgi:hypothetical protein